MTELTDQRGTPTRPDPGMTGRSPLPQPTSRIHAWLVMTPTLDGPGSYKVEIKRLPSPWHRFWVRVLLGFHYTQTSSPT